MGHKNSCEQIRCQLYTLDFERPVPQEIQKHLNTCTACRDEYAALKQLHKLTVASAPAVPNLSASVMSRIQQEKLSVRPEDNKRKRRLPLGTLAAAAAVLTVYVSVYHSKLPGMIFSDSQKSADYGGTEYIAADYANENAAPSLLRAAGGSDEPDEQNQLESAALPGEGMTNGAQEAEADRSEYDSFKSSFTNVDIPSKAGYSSATPETDSYDSPYKDAASGTDSVLEPAVFTKGISDNDTLISLGSSDGSDGATSTTPNADGANSLPPLSGETRANSASSSETENPQNVADAKEESEASKGGSAGGGSNSVQNSTQGSVSLKEKLENRTAQEVFEQLEATYPGRISYESMESVGEAVYLAFCNSLQDFFTDYTQDNLLTFAETYTAEN